MLLIQELISIRASRHRNCCFEVVKSADISDSKIYYRTFIALYQLYLCNQYSQLTLMFQFFEPFSAFVAQFVQLVQSKQNKKIQFNLQNLQKIFMEYKYLMLNPAPFSTESIEFKLSEPFLQSCALLSPNKPCESLTYSVSMETIQDHQLSPTKNQNRYLLEHKQKDQQENAQISLQKVLQFQLDSSFKLDSPKKLKQSNKKKKLDAAAQIQIQATQINLCSEIGTKNEGQFKKKPILKASQFNNQHIKSGNASKMGKVMSKIHSALKQSQTTYRIRCSNRKITETNEETKPMSYVMNESQNQNESPQIIRRKSEYLVDRTHKKQKMKWSQIFYSDRILQNSGSKYSSINHNKLLNNLDKLRYKNHSTMQPKTQACIQKQEESRSLQKQNKTKHKSEYECKKYERSNNKNEIEVFGKKINLTQRKGKSIIQLKNRSISQNFNQVKGVEQKFKNLLKKEDSVLQNVEINSKIFSKCHSTNNKKTLKQFCNKYSKQAFYS